MIINYSIPSSDLASRKLAIKERKNIENYISDNKFLINLNMSNISSISESYSDELFGVLVLKFGSEKVFKSIKLVDAKPNVLLSIANVIQRRMKDQHAVA